MKHRKAQSHVASSPRTWSDESGLIKGPKYHRNTGQSSNYGGLFSRALPDNILCSGVDDSDDEVESKRRSLAIDRALDTERERRKHRLNITAIGSCEQKRILWKQMRLRVRPQSQQEQLALREDVRKTVLAIAIRCLEVALGHIESVENPKMHADEDFIVSVGESLQDITSCTDYDEGTAAELVLQIAQEPKFETQLDAYQIDFLAVQRLVLNEKCSSFLACTCTDDYDIMRVLGRVFASGYDPTDHDWFHFERPRHGVYVRETQIKEGGKVLNFIDVYNRAERKKWLHVFEDLAALVFVADPSTYDVILEDGQRPLEESLVLFDSIVNSNMFKSTPIVLVLSNLAAFWRKMETHPLSRNYPEYMGITDQAALEFITQKFKAVNRSGKDLHVYHSRGVGVDNQYGFLDLLEAVINGELSVDYEKRKSRLSFIPS